MKPLGIMLIIIGLIVLIIALFLETTVTSSYLSTSGTYNMGLLQRQLIVLIISGIIIIVGFILTTGGIIIEKSKPIYIRSEDSSIKNISKKPEESINIDNINESEELINCWTCTACSKLNKIEDKICECGQHNYI